MEAKSLDQAKDLFNSLFPDLTVGHISVLGEGWDSIAILADDCIVFRIPKRPAVARQMEKEIRVVEVIQPYVSARVPKIEWIGPAHGDFAVSTVGYRKLAGTPLSNIRPRVIRDPMLKQIGQFLSELHTVPTSALYSAGVPWFRWTGDNSFNDPDSWEVGLRAFTDRILGDVVPLLSHSVGNRVTQEFAVFLGEAQHFSFQPVLLHGDFSPEHILVDDETGDIGIIDFGDCGMGDPAYDAWLELAPFYHGVVDETFTERQRFYRRLAPFHVVLYGLMVRDDSLVMNGLRQIDWQFI